MRKIVQRIAPLLILLAAVPLLAACNTMAGAGKDISNTGNAISNSAEHNQ